MSDFLESLPEVYREPLKAIGIDSAEKLAKNWADTQGMLGTSIRIPGKDAGVEDWESFDKKLAERVAGLVRLPADGDADGMKRLYSSLGVPEAPDKYTFDPVERLDESAGKAMRDWVAQIAHEANLTTAQAKRIYAAVGESTRDNTEAYLKGLEEQTGKLKAKWGQGFEQRAAIAKGAAKTFGRDRGEELAERIAADPLLLEAFAEVGVSMSEDELMVHVDRSRLPKSLAQINAQIAEIRGNPRHPFHDPMNPAHKHAQATLAGLYEEREALKGAAV